jgi:hypothetical protein
MSWDDDTGERVQKTFLTVQVFSHVDNESESRVTMLAVLKTSKLFGQSLQPNREVD